MNAGKARTMRRAAGVSDSGRTTMVNAQLAAQQPSAVSTAGSGASTPPSQGPACHTPMHPSIDGER